MNTLASGPVLALFRGRQEEKRSRSPSNGSSRVCRHMWGLGIKTWGFHKY